MNSPKNSRNRTLRLYSPSLAILFVLIPFFSYYMKQVKGQEAAQNDRAFRVLDLIASQFSTQIDGTHKTMDASLLLLEKKSSVNTNPDPHRCPQSTDFLTIQHYLKTYIPDKFTPEKDAPVPLVSVLEQRACEVVDAREVKGSPHSHAMVQFQDSRLYLELSHEGETPSHRRLRLRAFLDPAKMLARALKDDRSAIFDNVFLGSLEEMGDVLAQKSNPQVNVLLIDTLLKSARLHNAIEENSSSKGDDGKITTTSDLATAISGANQRFDVLVGGTPYVLFVVPAPFELEDERPAALKSKKNASTRIAFYGLVRKETLEKQALSLPNLALPAILLTLFACLAFLWPPLKLCTMSDRERLGKGAVANICIASFLACVFIGTLILSFGMYRTLSEEEDPTLQALANAIHSHLVEELQDGFKTAQILHNLKPFHQKNSLSFKDLQNEQPELARILETEYPFFKHLILSGPIKGAGTEQKQLFKITANVVPTPLISLPEAEFPFLARLELNPSIIDMQLNPGAVDRQPFILQSFVSPNTGEFLPIIAFPPPHSESKDSLSDAMRIMLTTELPSLVHTILPRGYGFAVIEPDGTVQFHSEPSRNLKENFLSECDEAGQVKLRQSMALAEKQHLNLDYGGQHVRAFVQPLGDTNENFGLTLVVFSLFSEQANRVTAISREFLESLGWLALSFSLVAGLYRFLRWRPEYRNTIDYLRHRVWPREEDKSLYLVISAWCLFWFAIVVAVVLCLPDKANRQIFPFLLASFGLLCLAGLLPWVQHKIKLASLLKHLQIESDFKWLPLKVAYSVVIFTAVLGVFGIFFIAVFQGCINHYRHSEEIDNRAFYAKRIEARGDRIRRVLHARNPEANRQTIDAANRKSFDLYQNDVELGRPSPISVLHTTPSSNSEIALPSRSWSALPSIDFNCLLQLYLPSLFLFGAIFAWLYQVVTRLFLLDFRKPDKIPAITPEQLEEEIEAALDPECKAITRSLIFAHPQSGTSRMLASLCNSLKSHGHLTSADNTIVDFSQLGAASQWDLPNACAAVAKITKENRLIILDNFEYQITQPESRRAKLALIETLVYSHNSSIYILTSSDPILLVQALLNEDPDDLLLQAELSGWIRVLSSFEPLVYRDNSVGAVLNLMKRLKAKTPAATLLTEHEHEEMRAIATREFTSTTFLGRIAKDFDISRVNQKTTHQFEDSLVHFVRQRADGQYRAVWMNCTSDERLALYQLAKDNWLNPQNRLAISHLLRKNLIVQNSNRKDDGPYSLMNMSFRSFVLESVTQYELDTWKAQQNLSLWPAVRMALGTIVLVLAAFLFYVERASFDTYFGYFAVLAGGGTAVVRIILQFFTKANPTIADLVGGGAPKRDSATA